MSSRVDDDLAQSRSATPNIETEAATSVVLAVLGGRKLGLEQDFEFQAFSTPHTHGERIRQKKTLREPWVNLGELVFRSTWEQVDSEETAVFESFFDLTPIRLKVIFDYLRTTAQGSSEEEAPQIVEFEQLKNTLRSANVNAEALQQLLQQVDKDSDGGLSYEEFEEVVQTLKMSSLLSSRSPEELQESCTSKAKENGVNRPSTRVLDYGVAKLIARSPVDAKSLYSFLYGSRPAWTTTRWIDVTSPAESIVKGLAIKYRLHPLALEDTLFQVQTQAVAKYDRYENHMFVMFPGMLLGGGVDARNAPWIPRRGRFWRHKSSRLNSTMRFSSQHSGEHATSGFRERSEVEPFLAITHFNVCIFLTTPSFDTLITVVDAVAGGENVFARVRNDLQIVYSRLRAKNALFLMYTVLDVLVDGYLPVINAFEAHIADLRQEMRERDEQARSLFDSTSHTYFVEKYHDMLSSLNQTKRRLRQALRVISHMKVSHTVDKELQAYLQDVQDHAQAYSERLESVFEDCRVLQVDRLNSHEAKFSTSLAVISIVSTIFLPGQFLSR